MTSNPAAPHSAVPMDDPSPPPRPTPSPDQDILDYVNNGWFQQLVPIRTKCFRCRADSPVVFAPYGTLMFGSKQPASPRRSFDITDAVVLAFERIGWRFQLRRSYCPSCKGLGST